MRYVAGWLRAAHFFPLTAVLALTSLIGIATARDDMDVPRFLLMMVGMLGAQLAIGWTNDYVDRDNDARYQPSKPVPSGLVDARLLPWTSAVAAIVAIVCAVALGVWPLVFLIAGLGSGLAYNFVFKDTHWSSVPFFVAFGVLPLYAWYSLDVYRDELLWLYVVASPLIVAVHLANTLPDIETDEAAGRRTLAVELGDGNSMLVVFAAFVVSLAVSVITALWVDYAHAAYALASWVACIVLLLAAARFYLQSPAREGRVQAFRLVCVAAIVFVTGWLAAV